MSDRLIRFGFVASALCGGAFGVIAAHTAVEMFAAAAWPAMAVYWCVRATEGYQ